MTWSGKSRDDFPLEASIPTGTVPLESILCTEELHRRPSGPHDAEKENRALVKLVSSLADSPTTILQVLAETILEITQCDSAGLSLLTKDGKTPDVCGKRFYWPAIAGMWNPHAGGGTPHNFGSRGDVLDQNRTPSFRHFERRSPYLTPVIPAPEECLLVPFYVAGEAVGTIWAIMHSERRKFDAEDDRSMASLGKFASSAYQTLVHIEDLNFQVSEREKAEEARDKARSELTHVARVMSFGTLTACIAHELNQPLSGIVTNASTCMRMLAADPPNVDGARETARRMVRDGNRASEVVTRLHTLFTKSNGATESVDLNEEAREVIALSSSELQRSQVTLRHEFADDLPAVTGDRVQLQQVILNLLQNASEAMSTVDDRPRELLIRTERDEGDQVSLSVRDAGVGFTAQVEDKIFEAFYTTKSHGMGIGLSISRSIIIAHHGRLWAIANDGPGATFSFSIPCAPEGLPRADSIREIQTAVGTNAA
jgi:signal transduction histidine kinase